MTPVRPTLWRCAASCASGERPWRGDASIRAKLFSTFRMYETQRKRSNARERAARQWQDVWGSPTSTPPLQMPAARPSPTRAAWPPENHPTIIHALDKIIHAADEVVLEGP